VSAIDLSWSGSIARITINRPEKHNALSLLMWKAIPQCFATIRRCKRANLVIIQGAGKDAFAAGADIGELEACVGSEDLGRAYMLAVDEAESAIASCRLPTIALIKGFCIGAGLEIAMACDLRFATDDSIFAAPPAKLGANYSQPSTRRLVELVGTSKAKDMLFTGQRITSSDALRFGLVDRVVGRTTIDEELNAYVDALAVNSQYSIQVAKLTIDEVCKGSTGESELVSRLRRGGFMHADMREGLAAFRQGRKPQYGRTSGVEDTARRKEHGNDSRTKPKPAKRTTPRREDC
jgi:enoyl-CoA hydratase